MNGIRQTLQHRHILAICAAIFGMLAVTGLQAQQWQTVYGPDDDSENGMNRVAPVLGLCTSQQYGGDQGYIAVGSSYLASTGTSHVYVVRTTNLGGTVWEKVYDINLDGLDDDGFSIVELADGSGFAVTGHTVNQNGNHDIFIMKIDCLGGLVWVNTYGTAGDIEFAYDIIETTTGDPTALPIPTNPGDLVVAGEIVYLEPSPNPPGPINIDAYLLRVTSTGTLIWDQAYDGVAIAPGVEHWERFHALTEAGTVGTAATGDIIAVGSTDLRDGTRREQGLVVRVDGNNGSLGGTPIQNAAHYGNPFGTIDPNEGDEIFTSVIELQNPAEQDAISGVQNAVIVGYSNAKTHNEIYAVKLQGGDPCSPVVERLLGDLGTSGFDDQAWCVREVDWEMSGSSVSQWDLAVTGLTDRNLIDYDAFLLTLNPGTLYPVVGGIGMLYGQSSGEDEWGRSVYPVDAIGGRTEGFILCGTNYGDPLNVGDPSDLYLIKTDNVGSSNSTGDCEESTQWDTLTVQWSTCYTPETMAWSTEREGDASERDEKTDDEVCEGVAKRTADLSAMSAQVRFTLASRELHGAENLRISDIRTPEESVTIQIYNIMGRLVSTAHSSGNQEVEIDLGYVPSGTYTVVVHDGSTLNSARIRILR